MDEINTVPLVFEIGKNIEQTQEAYEHEAKDLASMKKAFAMAVKHLEGYRNKMLQEMIDAKLHVKEVEYGKTYVNRCIELVSNLCLESEKKLLRAEGAINALESIVLATKKIYDIELEKQQKINKQINNVSLKKKKR